VPPFREEVRPLTGNAVASRRLAIKTSFLLVEEVCVRQSSRHAGLSFKERSVLACYLNFRTDGRKAVDSVSPANAEVCPNRNPKEKK
jgi:hypothetical protein